MSADCFPLLLLGESRRRELAQRIGRAAEEWRRTWIEQSAPEVRVEMQEIRARPVDIRAHEACCFGARTGGRIALVLVVPRRSLGALVGAPSYGVETSIRIADDRSLAAALEREALLRLAQCVLPAEAVETGLEIERLAASAPEVFREYDSARFACACLTLGDNRCVLDLLVAPDLVDLLGTRRAPAPDSERIERRRTAAGEQTVEVEAILGFAEVPISELAALSVGDVLVLKQSLSESGDLAIAGGERVSGVALGRVDGRRAIQIKGTAA